VTVKGTRRLVCLGRKPSPASDWWSDDDVLNVVLPYSRRHFWSYIWLNEVFV
jgi:hypothetical protein